MAIFDDFITLKEAGAISGYHPDYIGALVRANKVKGKKVGKNWYVSKKEVQEYFTTQHYVPVGRAFSGGIKVFFFCLSIAVLALAAGYFFEASKTTAVSAPVKSSLSDTVGPQTDAGSVLENGETDIAQPVPSLPQ